MRPNEISEKLIEYAEQLYEQREKNMGSDNMRKLERLVMLLGEAGAILFAGGRWDERRKGGIDGQWMEHLTAMDRLRQQAGLYAAKQIDPIVAYKKEGYAFFESLKAGIQHDVVHTIYKVNIEKKEAPAQRQTQKVAVPAGKKVGRNEPCPCGSGKKYKHCCGR
jgi:preprotein translocase subunit SecA